jgi:integrase
MTPRPRKRNYKGLPENLYALNVKGFTYYRYRHPVTGKMHLMGKDKAKAIAAAKQLNTMLMPESDLVAAIMGDETVNHHIKWFFAEIVPHREYADATIEIYKIRCRQIAETLGDRSISAVSVKDFSDLMAAYSARSAQQVRQVGVDLFKTAIGRGLIEHNPAEQTNKPVSKKVRRRMTEEQYQAIYSSAPAWLKNAMDLALYTLQRREDVTGMKWPEGGELYVIQGKTKKHDTGYLKIAIGPKLKEIISRCRDDIVSPYLVHRRPEKKIQREGCDHWTQVTPEMVSRELKEVRDGLQEFAGIPMAQRPTFHEIRALGQRMYRNGGINPKELGGWASEKMAKNYDSGHDEIRWVEAKSF